MPGRYYGTNNDLPGPRTSQTMPSDFRRSQHFEVVQGCSSGGGVTRMIPGKVGIGRRPLENERHDTWKFGEKGASRSPRVTGSLPKWIVNDKKILRFWSYFVEPVTEGGLGTSHKRKFNIYYFLEDDTIKVTEIHSSHGRVTHETFIRRHRVPFKGGDSSSLSRLNPNDPYINFWDLNLGIELELYGRVHIITDCDPFTSSHLTRCGVQLNPSVAEIVD